MKFPESSDSGRLAPLRLWTSVPLFTLLVCGCAAITGTNSSTVEQLNTELAAGPAEYARLSQADGEIQKGIAALGAELTVLNDRVGALCSSGAETEQEAGAASTVSVSVTEREPEKLVVGRREKVWVEALQLALPARIDTGAETASLDARNITLFERDGKSWVRFDIPHPNREELITLELPKVREALIAQSNTEQLERRAVVKLGIQIGTVRQLAEFTLSDRGHLDYQMLVGRNILQDVMLVDVSGKNLVPLPASIAESAQSSARE
ncbi:MAG: RimK/LysX family protein [Halieaceae bacterium]|nr:RimK/LysX family protein [Halieaceae bacterium]